MLDVSANQGAATRRIRLVIADRQPIVLEGLRSVFAAQHDFEVVAACSSGTGCLEAIRNLTPDVALFADTLPDLTVSEILATTKGENLPTRLVFFAEPEGDGDLTAAISAGACSVISKYATADTVLRSLRLMTECVNAPAERSQGLSPNGKEVDSAKIETMLGTLTHRESQIVQLVSEGLSNKEIARQLNVSQGTIKVHLHNIFQKLEISNRTVLATIALLRRPAGFTTLSLAALAFAILSDVKASDTTDTLPDDDSTAFKDLDHPAFELWKKAILRHVVVTDSGDTAAPPQRGSFTKESQPTHPVERMQTLHAAGQVPLSNFGRSYGPIGSSTPYLFISPLLQAINDSLAGSLTEQEQFASPAIASNPMRGHGGYGTFATAAGALIYTLDNSHAAVQALDPGATLIDTSALAAMDATAHVATITLPGASHVAPNDVDNLASGPVVHGSHPPLAGAFGHDSVFGGAGQTIHGGAGDDTSNGTGLASVSDGGSGNDTIKGNSGGDTIQGGSCSDTIDSNNGNGTSIGEHGGDQLTGSKGDDIFAHRSANDSNSSQLDTIIDFTLGEDKINLAAFGALAFLHMTSTTTFVPPHTLAWIYNSVSNETIIYVNPTDDSLHIGDPGLLEIHLQGVVSVAGSDFVYEPEAATVAAALEGIDAALLLATASDGTVLATGSADASIEAEASESGLGAAGVGHMPADDGLRLHFGRAGIGSIVSSKLTNSGDDSPYATEESNDGAFSVPAHVPSINLVHGNATVLTEGNLTFNKAPVQANTSAVATEHGNPHLPAVPGFFEFGIRGAAIVVPVAATEVVETGVAPGNSAGHGNEQHASNSAAAKASEAVGPAESGDTPGHSNPHHPSHSTSASIAGQVEPINTSAAPGNHASQSYAQHASQSATAKASAAAEPSYPDITPGNGVGHGTAQHTPNPAAAKTSETIEQTEPRDTPGHGNPHHPSHSSSASIAGQVDPIDASAAPGNSVGHAGAQHASQSASAKASAAAEPAQPDIMPGNGVGHGAAQHVSNSAAANASEAVELTEPDVAPGNSAGHANSQHASQSAAANASTAPDLAEASIISANLVGLGNAQHVSNPAVAMLSATTEPTIPGVTPGQSNSEHPSHSAPASIVVLAESVETGGLAQGNSGGHGNSPQASQTVATSPSGATELTDPACDIGSAGHEAAFHFKSVLTPSSPTAAVDPEELDESYVLLGRETELTAVLEGVPAAIEEHAASHVSIGQHHTIGHFPHDLLP